MRKHPLLILAPALALALFACGGGNNAAPANTGGAQAKQSRLVALDPQGLDKDLELPDFTRYWTDAEQRNGNVYPIDSTVDDELVLTVRLDKDGKFARLDNGRFKPETMISIAADMQQLAREHWIDKYETSPAALLLFADRRAPYEQVLKLCKEIAAQQVSNLWIVTHDERDDALRLMPLFLDNTQVFREWYGLTDKELARTAHLHWLRAKDSSISDTRTLTFPGANRSATTDAAIDWGKQLVKPMQGAPIERVQFHLPRDARLDDFSTAVNEVSALGFKDIEPFWPALDQVEDSEPIHQRRKLADFEDTLGLVEGVSAPTLSDFWRASSTDNGLPAAAEVDPALPVLGVRVDATGRYATRTHDGEWEVHADDLGVLEAMRMSAGEIDFDLGLSDLQVVLAMDREADWSHFMRVREMMNQARCYRLMVVTTDAIGPTLRLLELNLPLADLPESVTLAQVKLEREGAVADENYKAVFFIDGATNEATGPRFTATLTLLAENRQSTPDVLGVGMPMDEPFETYFKILNALAWLGMGELRFMG